MLKKWLKRNCTNNWDGSWAKSSLIALGSEFMGSHRWIREWKKGKKIENKNRVLIQLIDLYYKYY